jgi:hypothetical protein
VRLVRLGGAAAVLRRDGRLVVLDRDGRPCAEYQGVPFSLSLLEWPGVAVEVRRAEGLLVVHDRFDTSIGALPDSWISR